MMEMPDRLIRDELLTSKRYWSVPIEAQQLFVHLLLCADDTARFTGCNFSIRAKCFPARALEPEKMETLLSLLADADLIRLYNVCKDRFIFVPRFRQRLRYARSKYPPPPIEINDLDEEKTDLRLTEVRPKLQKRREVKRSEEKKNNKAQAPVDNFVLPDWIPEEAWQGYEEMRKKLRKPMTDRARRMAVSVLAKLRDSKQNVTAVIDQSVLNSWAGLFPVKGGEVQPSETYAQRCARVQAQMERRGS